MSNDVSKFLGRKIIKISRSDIMSRQDNMGCGLSNPRRVYWEEFHIEGCTKWFDTLKEAKAHIKTLKRKRK